MAYFAEIDGGDTVIRVLAIADRDTADSAGVEAESIGVEFCRKLFGEDTRWAQTSYNTHAGVHKLGGTPLRKNYAGKGYSWREDLDAFCPPTPFDSWHLNNDTCQWEPPVPYPEGDKRHSWDEDNLKWGLIDLTDAPGGE